MKPPHITIRVTAIDMDQERALLREVGVMCTRAANARDSRVPTLCIAVLEQLPATLAKLRQPAQREVAA